MLIAKAQIRHLWPYALRTAGVGFVVFAANLVVSELCKNMLGRLYSLELIVKMSDDDPGTALFS